MLTNKNIYLKFNLGFKWYSSKSIAVKGYFYVDDVFYEKEEALKYLDKNLTHNNRKDIFERLNGVFTILISEGDHLEMVCDVTRLFPLFYAIKYDVLFVSDDIQLLKSKIKTNQFDKLSKLEFKVSNHTHSNKTLLKNIFQLEASKYLIFNKTNILNNQFLFHYSIKKESSNSFKKLKSEAIQTIESTFLRFLKSINNKTILLPLSGGFDSRLLAVFLKKHNYKNVICFTYGRKQNFEVENSKKTAKQLGYKWFFIEYSTELIANFLETNEFLEYAHFAGKYSSMPYLQEYFAVKYLKEELNVPNDSIVVPGFAGDFLGGSEYNKVSTNLKTEKIADAILNIKLNNFKVSKSEKSKLKEVMENNVRKIDNRYETKIPSTVFEDYVLKERIAKYIFNSASYYLYFGFEVRFPYWDLELLNFFKELPIQYKKMKKFYDDVLTSEYFEKHKVNFENEIQPKSSDLVKQRIKDKIKPLLTDSLKAKILKKHDWNNYEPITKQMLLQIKQNGLNVNRSYKDYNEIISQWYIYFCENKLQN